MARIEYALDQDIIAVRRQRVSSLRNRGLTHLEIWQQLSMPEINGKPNPSYLENPKNGKPFDRTTITRDLLWLREENHRQAGVNTEDHLAQEYAEIQEVKRAAWAGRDGRLALRAIELEMKLVGTYKSGINLNVNINISLVNQVCNLLEQKGMKPSDVFESMIQELSDEQPALIQS